ncbi:kinesin-like protein KIF18A isoform X1 [Triplophysa rosa]|uniref:Kinesin-like protein n=1 Tax=Triplophysa rosa TaxID=992332 RepID=A0A9W7X6S3_TRIRA|nr:kinesin-like protein KIF18A isoform X1 [Triplophysa rosa]KAI7814719.1 kinesin-like protein KIF18A [Triplophysa rosa]
MPDVEVCSHVKVVVRVRPLNDKEKSGNYRNSVHVVDNHMLIFDPKEEQVTFFRGQRVGNRDVRKRTNKDLKFVFDSVFREDSSQMEVFENTTKSIVDGVLNGYNCTVFAYGATGAGKTHTMLGTCDTPGVMFLTMKELFARMDLIKEDKVFDIAFSYLEVYNEQIRDLLTNSGPLAVREDGSNGVVVQGLTLHQPKSAEHILEALDYGNKNRTQHPTDMNATSSRSHAVFQIYLRQQDKTASLNPNVRVAKMSLIDLAGSERASATNAKGARLREGANINRSLLALGNVINTLANPKCKKTHIPYRDSKLTRLLKDSLGGNCRTVMIANVSPSSLSYEDTHNTLKYANRAKEIKSTLKSNVMSLDSHIGQYAIICEKQKAEIIMLKQKLKEYEERKVEVPALNPIPVKREAEFEKMSESLRSVFAARQLVRKEQLDIEKRLYESRLTMRHRELWHQQSLIFFPDNRTERATCKYERKLSSLKSHQEHLQKRLLESEKHFQENEGWLHRIENEMKLLGHEGQSPEELKRELQCHQLQVQISDLQQRIKHTNHLIGVQDQENAHTHKLVNALLSTCRRQHLALKAASIATDDAEREELERLVNRERGVVWADQEKPERNNGGTGSTHLQPILSFSDLVSHQSTPCSAEKRTRQSSQRLRLANSSKGCIPQHQEPEAECPKKPIRRKLSVSPANPDEGRAVPVPSHYPPALQEVLRDEGMFPLQYTPQGQPHSSSTFDPNSTFDIGHTEDTNTASAANDTVILSPEPPRNTTLQALQANNGKEPAKRSEIPSLLDLRRSKPSYMAMTSAAKGKRKFCSNSGKEDHSQAVAAAPKRIKREPCEASKPLRIRRFEVSSENEPSRIVVRSVSEGNLHQLDQRKPKSGSMGPVALFKKATKRM